jgi:activator of HSP90 ATPase
MTTKSFTGFLVLNWKTGKITVKKRKSKSTSPFDIVINYDIKVNIPDLKQIELKGEFTIPEVQVKEAVLQEL